MIVILNLCLQLRLVSFAFPKLSQLSPRHGNDADLNTILSKHAFVFRLYLLLLKDCRLFLLVGFDFLFSFSMLVLEVLSPSVFDSFQHQCRYREWIKCSGTSKSLSFFAFFLAGCSAEPLCLWVHRAVSMHHWRCAIALEDIRMNVVIGIVPRSSRIAGCRMTSDQLLHFH
jgi:hypothetical protein